MDIAGPVAYTDHGGSGLPMVLVHGLGGSQDNWMLVASTIGILSTRATRRSMDH